MRHRAWRVPPPPSQRLALLIALLLLAGTAHAQQRPDADYQPQVAEPSHARGSGPQVCVDEAHHNFHRLDGGFGAFGRLLAADGYPVRALTQAASAASLQGCALLVVANAQPDAGSWDDYPYPTPSAFDDAEVEILRGWVEAGGALLLIADHMPLAGAAAALAQAFGFWFTDGFAVRGFKDRADGEAAFGEPQLFTRAASTLADHPVTRGRGAQDRIERVRGFIGQAMHIPVQARAVLTLPAGFVSLMPRRAWQFTPLTPVVPVGGWSQGATLELGRGRFAAFGEAGLFTAQRSGPDARPMGLHAPLAEDNARFVSNLVRWLTEAARPSH